jgi:hypothetical protein
MAYAADCIEPNSLAPQRGIRTIPTWSRCLYHVKGLAMLT